MRRLNKASEISWAIALSCCVGVIACSSFVRLFTTEDNAMEAAFNILQSLPSGYSECGSNFTLYQITDGSTFVKITMNRNCDQAKLKSCEVLQGKEAMDLVQTLQQYIIEDEASENAVALLGNKREFQVLLQACQQLMRLEGVLTKLDTDMSLIRRARYCKDEPSCRNPTRTREGFPMINDGKTPITIKEVASIHVENEISFNPMFGGIYPGTLWCGVGNIADDVYTRLGVHAKADECCRSHDLCKPTIRKFQSRYQLYNPTLLRMSHCSCDREFYNCLKRAQTDAAADIGDLFFNTLRLKCFEYDFKETCTWTAFGVCLHSQPKCAAKVGRITDF
ncbi:uncharacterized protein [Antedon mediterranea]|uniref:uncharacterized protein n=1 Tax=Antedon mediterranea TaxID=105859 RepID=UPI003AF45A90